MTGAALPDGWLHVLIDVAPADADRSAAFWAAALGSSAAPRISSCCARRAVCRSA